MPLPWQVSHEDISHFRQGEDKVEALIQGEPRTLCQACLGMVSDDNKEVTKPKRVQLGEVMLMNFESRSCNLGLVPRWAFSANYPIHREPH